MEFPFKISSGRPCGQGATRAKNPPWARVCPDPAPPIRQRDPRQGHMLVTSTKYLSALMRPYQSLHQQIEATFEGDGNDFGNDGLLISKTQISTDSVFGLTVFVEMKTKTNGPRGIEVPRYLPSPVAQSCPSLNFQKLASSPLLPLESQRHQL